jgi:hypothetical protein
MERNIVFRVKFKPKFGWVDQIYLGNILTESLGAVSRQSGSFDFEIERIDSEQAAE